jgi:hypothetical protein
MFKELLEEANSSNKIAEKLKECEDKISELKVSLKNKQDQSAFTTRKVDSIQFNLMTLLKNTQFEDWNKTIKNIYKEFFDKDGNFLKSLSKNNEDVFLPSDSQDSLKEELIK